MPKKAARAAETTTQEAPAKLKPGDELPEDVQALFEKHDKYLQAGRANYGRADKVLEQILERCEVGCQHVLEAKGKKPPQTLTLIDKFATTNQVWAGSSCKRLAIEAKAIKPQDRAAAGSE